MFNLSKNLIGVEKKQDGTLLYQGRGLLSFFQNKKTTYKIDSKTYNYLKIIAIIGLCIVVPLLSWLKINDFFGQVFLIFCAFIILDTFVWKLINKFVESRSKKIYEE